MDFAEWLRSEIDQRGMSQADLARESGLTPASISRLLNRTRGPGSDTCISLAGVFGYPVDVIYRIAGLLPFDTDKDTRGDLIASLAKQLPDKEYNDLLEYIHFRLKISSDR